MFRQSRKLLLGGYGGFFSTDDDPFHIAAQEMIDKRIKEFEGSMPLTGWERVKFGLFSKDEYGDRTPFFHNLVQGTMSSSVMGAFYGGYKTSQVAYLDFMRTNQATAFLTHMDAKRRLQDKIMISFLRGALKLGWRTGLFTFTFIGVSNAIALYRNKDGVLEYVVGGAAAGASYRMHIGLRQAFVGSILGLGLGTAAGILSNIVFRLTGYSMTDVRYTQYAFSLNRSSVDKRADELAEREHETDEKSDMVQRMERDEKQGKILDDLQNV